MLGGAVGSRGPHRDGWTADVEPEGHRCASLSEISDDRVVVGPIAMGHRGGANEFADLDERRSVAAVGADR